MKKKLLIILILGLFIALNFAFAQRTPEVTYPVIVPGVSPPTGQTDIAGYFRYIYTAAIALGGVICLIALIWGGLQFLISAGNPAQMADARERILYGIIGFLILLGSFVFLNEINPQLTTFTPPMIRGVGQGIIVYSDQDCGNGANGLPGVLQPLPEDIRYEKVFDVKRLANESISVQSIWTFESDEDILIEFYENPNCEGNPSRRIPNPQFRANTCISGFGIIQNVQCIKLTRHTPGIHLFTQSGARIGQATGYHHILVNSAGSLPDEINDKIKTLALIENSKTEPSILYGAILHRNEGAINEARGWSTIWLPAPYASAGAATSSIAGYQVTYYDNPVWDDASSVTVFKVAAEAPDFWIKICVDNNCTPRPGCPGVIEIYPFSGTIRRQNWTKDGNLVWEEEKGKDFTINGLNPEVVRGIDVISGLFDDEYWCNNDKNATGNTRPIKIQDGAFGYPKLGERSPNGISAVKIQPEAVKEEKLFLILNDREDAVANYPQHHNPSLVISADVDALSEVGFDNVTGSIIVIKGQIQ